jgi:hypothetical protein
MREPEFIELNIGNKGTLKFKKSLLLQGGERVYTLMFTPKELEQLQQRLDEYFPSELPVNYD